MISRLLAALVPVADETIIVGGPQAPAGVRLVPDEKTDGGPLAAIHTGMKAARADVYLVVACDMPFITTGLLGYLLSATCDFDAVIPVVGERDQPLCAAYSRACLPAIAQALAAGSARVADFFPKVRLRRVSEAQLVAFGSPDVLFFNVNSSRELALAQQMAEPPPGSTPTPERKPASSDD